MRVFNLLLIQVLSVCALASMASAQNSISAPDDNVLQDFTSDGCSLSPDGVLPGQTQFVRCCVEHDIAYWMGGSRLAKLKADLRLKACIKEKSNAFVAAVYFQGVRIGGEEILPTAFHWGYGWTKRRGYFPLSRSEKMQVEEKFSLINWDEIYRSLGLNIPINQ